jgi:Flp pilus assembly protein TadD
MRRFLSALAVAVAAAIQVPALHAAGDDSAASPGAPADPDAEAGKAAIRAQNWPGAIDAFKKVAARDPRDADAQNWIGFAYRKAGKLDEAFKHYNEALRLDSRHRGAHEYIGEAYLMKGDLAKAREHVAALDRICFFGCTELSDLRKAVAEYEKKAKK